MNRLEYLKKENDRLRKAISARDVLAGELIEANNRLIDVIIEVDPKTINLLLVDPLQMVRNVAKGFYRGKR